MSQGIIIREATEADLDQILDIYNDAILNTTAVYDYKPHTLDMRRQWYSSKIEAGIPVLVATAGSSVAGFASYGPFRAWAAYKYSAEHSVYVHPSFRKRGIAGNLLSRLIEEAQKRDIHVLIAGIDADNDISIHLHKNLGFREAGHFKEVGYKFGKWLDLKFFELILQTPLQPVEA